MGAKIELKLTFVADEAIVEKNVPIKKAVIGGWTGRDKEALQHHIDEMAKLGVAPPEKKPMFYRVGVSRLVTSDAIQVVGDGSSGEVEYVLLKTDGRLWVGAGSDHTDRSVEHIERMGITVAKQLCDKPIASCFWLFDDIRDHWEKLELISRIRENETMTIYQQGPVSNILSPQELLECYEDEMGGTLEEETLIFGGTVGAIGGIRFSDRFQFELIDPVRDRRISHAYEIESVPIKG